jgi:superfamily II DNA or RNA helicase
MTLTVTPVSFALVADMYWIPVAEVDAHAVRDYFTIKARIQIYTGQPHVEEQPIPIFKEDAHVRPGLIGVPLAEGERLFPTDEIREELSDGSPFTEWTRLPDPEHPNAAPGQAEFMDLAYAAAQENYSSLLKAETGTGKTVVSLGLAARIGLSTLVLVPTVQLLRQWVQQAEDVLGVPREHIGVVQGEKCQFHKPFVVGMMKSNVMRVYPPEFYHAFGMVIVDELHNTGASTISRTQGLFDARYKIGLTATDKRRDGADKVYKFYYGEPAFERSMPGIRTTVHAVPFNGPKIQVNRRDQLLAALAADHKRNKLLTEVAAHWYDQGHDVLMLTEYVDHAYNLQRYLKALGVPEDETGMFTNQKPAKKGSKKRVKNKQTYLDWCKAEPAIIIATYGMMKEGLDVPRLNRGMDCLPRAEMEQALGRIRRRIEGKKNAVWMSLWDRNTPKLNGLHYGRMKSISNLANVTIEKTSPDAML